MWKRAISGRYVYAYRTSGSVEGPKSLAPAGLLRISVGVEHPQDIIDDLYQALSVVNNDAELRAPRAQHLIDTIASRLPFKNGQRAERLAAWAMAEVECCARQLRFSAVAQGWPSTAHSAFDARHER